MGSKLANVVPFDPITREIVEGSFEIRQHRRAPAALAKQGFIMVSQADALRELARAKPGAEAHAVFLVLLTMVDYENWMHVDQGVVSKESGVARSHVSRAIAKLVELGVLVRGPKAGRFSTLRLNPAYGWKGKPNNYRSAVVDFGKARAEAQERTEP